VLVGVIVMVVSNFKTQKRTKLKFSVSGISV
jgi:hypothetical protein